MFVKKRISKLINHDFFKTKAGRVIALLVVLFFAEIITQQITLYGFRQVEMRMEFEEVNSILWGGTEISEERTGSSSSEVSIYSWGVGFFGNDLNIHFRRGRVIKKTLFGLDR